MKSNDNKAIGIIIERTRQAQKGGPADFYEKRMTKQMGQMGEKREKTGTRKTIAIDNYTSRGHLKIMIEDLKVDTLQKIQFN